MNIILESLIKWFAPILSFTTEEIYQLIFKNDKSIHLEEFPKFPNTFENLELKQKWDKLIEIRNICNISIEEKRGNKEIGSSLEAMLEIELDKKSKELVKDTDLSELCITSSVVIKKDNYDKIKVDTTKAVGEKCPICWKISKQPCMRHGK